MKRFCYLIGSFPEQTHTFFWREILELRKMGADIKVVSTQLPKSNVANHKWVEDALNETKLLHPVALTDLFAILFRLLKSFPIGWIRCVDSILRADVSSLKERLRLFVFVLYGARFAEFCQKNKISHTHVGFCRDAANIAMFAKMLGGTSYSLSLHGDLSMFGENQRQKWTYASFGTVVSSHLIPQLKSAVGDSLPELIIAPMGVDVSGMVRSFPYVPWRYGETLRIISVARLTPTKGQLEIVEAAGKIKKQGINVEIVFAGVDSSPDQFYKNKLIECAKELGLENALKLLGAIPEVEVYKQLERAHIFILASYAEGLGVAAVEAMGMGVPVIVSDIPGLGSLVTDGETGLLTAVNNPEQLAEKIMVLLNNAELAQQMSVKAEQQIKHQDFCRQSATLLLQKMLSVGN